MIVNGKQVGGAFDFSTSEPNMEEKMRVITEKNGGITTVIINRPGVRNAVDRPTADELAEAFRAIRV